MEHKKLVLEVLYKITKNSDTMIEIFMNYDCDYESVNLYEHILNALAKVARGSKSDGKTDSIDEHEMKLYALNSCVNILGSLIKACPSLSDETAPNSPARSRDDMDDARSVVSESSIGLGLLEVFDAKRKHLETFQTGCVKFALKPKAGIEFFVANGLVTMEPKVLAKFFLDHMNELDKTQV